MNLLSSIILMAPAQGDGASSGGGMVSMLVMFGLVFVVMYFFMIRPQQKRQKEHQQMLAGIKKGDKVVTSAGIHGTVSETDDKTMTLQIADNVKIKFEKTAVTTKLS
ncbi:MAG TPA: preprotein translocase subunit YajC [Candidatus Kapabacteria bacterium]|nr:preprotein translocase subunit YajC [Candidatus Kapabacteria bacterium]